MRIFMTVKEASERYRVSKASIYRLAKVDPRFPALNVGPKKKIIINEAQFKEWLDAKNFKEELIKLPSNSIVFRRRINETTKCEY